MSDEDYNNYDDGPSDNQTEGTFGHAASRPAPPWMPEGVIDTTRIVEPKPHWKNVTEAIVAIMGEVGGIEKSIHPPAPGQRTGLAYAYRGIEELTSALQPLFVKHGVVFFPRGTHVMQKDIVVNGNPWTDTFIEVEYEVSHADSDTSKIIRVPGIGRDNSDKGSNKGMSQAFKYALLQTFCISDPADDTDGTTETADTPGLRSAQFHSAAPPYEQHTPQRATGGIRPAPNPHPVETPTGSAGGTASEAQVGKIRAQFRTLGIGDRDEQVQYVVDVIGKPVSSLTLLSKAFASAVIQQQIDDIAVLGDSAVGEGSL